MTARPGCRRPRRSPIRCERVRPLSVDDGIGSKSLDARDVPGAAHAGDVAAEALADPDCDRADATTRPDDQRLAALCQPAEVAQRLQARHRDGR